MDTQVLTAQKGGFQRIYGGGVKMNAEEFIHEMKMRTLNGYLRIEYGEKTLDIARFFPDEPFRTTLGEFESVDDFLRAKDEDGISVREIIYNHEIRRITFG